MPAALLKTLAAQGVTDPFPIQGATLPNSLAGRDILGRGRTGSGKTLAFGLALLARTAGRRAEPRAPLALVLVPTRELAQQVTDALTPYATSVNLRIATVVGGMSITQAVRHAAPRRRGARRHARPAEGPHRARRLPARPGLDHRPRRGRPDGRHGLHAAGHRAAQAGRAGRSADAVLRDAGQEHRPAGQDVPDRPGRALRRPVRRRRHHHGAPRAARGRRDRQEGRRHQRSPPATAG